MAKKKEQQRLVHNFLTLQRGDSWKDPHNVYYVIHTKKTKWQPDVISHISERRKTR
jgi:hypothetical protein